MVTGEYIEFEIQGLEKKLRSFHTKVAKTLQCTLDYQKYEMTFKCELWGQSQFFQLKTIVSF